MCIINVFAVRECTSQRADVTARSLKEHILLLTNTYLHEHKAQFWINRITQSGHMGLGQHRAQSRREKYKKKRDLFHFLYKEKELSTNRWNLFQWRLAHTYTTVTGLN